MIFLQERCFRKQLFPVGFLVVVSIIVLSISGSSAGCGGGDGDDDDSSPFSISSVKEDGTTNSVVDTSVPVASAFRITFSKKMKLSTVSTSTLLLYDNKDASVTGTVVVAADSDSIADNEFLFTPESSLKGATTYTLTIKGGSDGVKSSSSDILTEDQKTSVKTKCASNDPFGSSASNSCFTFSNTNNQTNLSGNTNDAAKTTIDDSSDGRLKLSFSARITHFNANLGSQGGFQTLPSLHKKVSGDFRAEMTVVSANISDSSLYSGASAEPPYISIGLADSPTDPKNVILCTHSADRCSMAVEKNGVLELTTQANTSQTTKDCGLSGDPPYTHSQAIGDVLHIIRSGSTLSCYYKPSGGAAYIKIGSDQTISSMPTEAYLVIGGQSRSESGTSSFVVDDLTFVSGGAVGQ